jgi:gliding motility-associated-like protein
MNKIFKILLISAIFYSKLDAQIVAGISVNGSIKGPLDTLRICRTSSITFYYAATNAITASWTYQGGNPASSNSTTFDIVQYNTNGTFKVKQIVTNGNLIDSTFTNVVVTDDKPLVDFTFAPTNECASVPINFTSTTTGATSYIWKWGDGSPNGSGANASHSFSSATGVGTQTFNVTLIAYNAVGCVDSITKPITVKRTPDANLGNADPSVTFGIFNGIPTFRRCSNSANYNFSFVNASTTVPINTLYQINWGDGSPDTSFPSWTAGAIISHVYPLGSTTLTLTVTGNDGCKGIRQFNFFVGSTPAGGISSPGNTAVCAPQLLTFALNNTNSNPIGTIYSINFSDGSPGLQFTHPPPPTVDHLFTEASCGYTAGAYSNSFSANLTIQNPCGTTSGSVVPIYISSKPRSLITVSPDTNVCVGVPVNIGQIPIPGGGFIEFTGGTSSNCNASTKSYWEISPAAGYTVNAGTLGSSNGQTNFLLWTNGSPALSLTFTQSGFYTITYLVANQCGIDTVKRIICVRQPPIANYALSADSVCVPNLVTTVNNSTPLNAMCVPNGYNWQVFQTDPLNCGTGGVGYAYTNGTNASSPQPAFSFSQPGRYIIRLTARANTFANICPISSFDDTVIVKGPPKVAINPIASICVGNDINPTANVSNCYANMPASYSWTFAGGTPNTSASVAPGPINYSAIATNPVLLSVSNECGSTVANTTFQTTALPTANAGTDKIICSGSNTTIGVNTGLYTYTWSPTIGLSNANIAVPTVSLNYTGAALDTTYTYVVNVSAGANCNIKDTVLVTVKKQPTLAVSPTSVGICIGDSAKLYVNGADSYSWSPLTNLNLIAPDTAWARPTITTTYTVTGTLAATSCSTSTNIVVTVKPYPATNAGNDTTVCLSATAVNLTGFPTGGTWTGTNITTSGVFNPNAAGLGTYTQYYTATLNGCSRMDSLRITVINNPIANAGTDTTICAGSSSFVLAASPVGGTWSGSGLVTAGGTFNPTTAGTYNLTYSYGSGTCAASDTKQIIVQPGIGNNIITASQAICGGATPNILVGSTPTGGNGTYIFQWQESANGTTWTNIGGANNIDFAPPPLTMRRFYRRLVSTLLCANQPSAAIEITINPDAEALFTPTTSIGCAPFNITNAIINPSAFPAQNSMYNWYANGNLIGTNTTATFPGYTINNYNDSVTIRLIAISQFGCKNDTIERKFYTEDKPFAAFTKSVDTACGPVSVVFNNTTPNTNYFNYIWNFGDGQTSLLAQPGTIIFQPSINATDTTYIITLKAFKNCDTSVFTRTIRVKSKPRAIFLPNKTEGCSPMTVTFNNFSLGNQQSYTWNFGDGSPTITGLAPVTHTFYSGIRDTFFTQLTVTNECGTDTLLYPIIVNPNNIFLDFSVNTLDRFGCAPQTVRIYNSSAGAATYTYNFGDGSPNVSTIKGLDTIIHVYNTPGTYTISLFGQNSCTDTTDYETVTVHPSPTSNFSVMPVPACINDTLFFANTSTGANLNFNWNFGDGTTSIQANPTKTYSLPGTYNVTLTTSIVYPSGKVCSAVSPVRSVVIVDTLQGSFTLTPLSTNCAPYIVKVKNNALGNPNTTWSFGDGTPLVVGDSATHTYLLPGSYTITMVTTSASGCKFKDVKTVVVNGAYGDMNFSPANICLGQNVTFNAISNNAVNYIFVYGDGDSTITSNNVATHTYTQPGYYIPYIYFQNAAGCRVVRYFQDTIKVDSVQANFSTNLTQNCGSTLANYTSTSFGYFGISNYSWQLANGFNGTGSTTSQTYNNNISFNATLTVTGAYGCTKTITKPVNIQVYVTPSVSVSTPSSACVNTPLTFTANVSSADPIASYDWSFGNSTFANTPTATVTYGAPGNYIVRLITTTIYNCADTQNIPITIAPIPFINAGNDKLICAGSSVQLNTIGNNGSIYSWTPSSNLSCTNCPNPIATPTTSTSYVVSLSSGTGCVRTDTVTVAVVQKQYLTPLKGDTLCIGQSTQLQAIGTDKFLWSPSSTLNNASISNPVATPTQTTQYRVIGTDQYNCFNDTAFALVVVSQYPVINIGPDTTLATGSLYQIPFTASFGPFATYNWTPLTDLSCNSCPTPILSASSDKCYAVEATNIFGCTGRDTMCVKTYCNGEQLFIPNAFTPDGDGVNDIFYLKSKGISQVKTMRIFNRWGNKIFEKVNGYTNTPTDGWDGKYQGKKLPPDVYVYIIEAVCTNGKIYSYKGDVTILQ